MYWDLRTFVEASLFTSLVLFLRCLLLCEEVIGCVYWASNLCWLVATRLKEMKLSRQEKVSISLLLFGKIVCII